MKKPKRGRPRKPAGEHYETPHFSIGRVLQSVQDEINAAIERSGETKTSWCTDALLTKARRGRKRTKSG